MKQRCKTLAVCGTLLIVFVALGFSRPAAAQLDFVFYDDALQNGAQNWYWNGTYDVNAVSYIHAGSKSIAATYAGQWAALQLGLNGFFNTASYDALTFYINGGAVNGRQIFVKLARNYNVPDYGPLLNNYIEGGSVAANVWRKVTIPLADLNADNVADVTSLVIQDYGAGAQPTFYLDDIKLTARKTTVDLAIDAARVIRTTDARTYGLNATIWDANLRTRQTLNLMKQMGTRLFRLPGGSLSDDYHWKGSRSDSGNFAWSNDTDTFANLILGAKAQAVVVVNYGSGTDQEAADWVNYCNVTKRYNFRYWEIGNENYGSWEADKNSRPHDPYTYAVRAASYIQKMKAVDPTIKIGIVAINGEDAYANYNDHSAYNARTNSAHYGWTPVVLATLKSLGVTPDYLTYHRYDQGPGGENDARLLQSSATWKNDAADLRQQLTDYLGSEGAKVDLMCTENNSVYSNPGKQMTSIVNALFMADSFGNLMQTEFKGMVWWDLRNSQDSGNNNSVSLYGWRNYGDYGVISPAYDTYPTYHVGKLLNFFVQKGDKIVKATSDSSLLTVYASLRRGNTLALLVINKSPNSVLTGNIALSNFVPARTGNVYTYGIPQDDAARTGIGSRDVALTAETGVATAFSRTFEPYSATLLLLSRRPNKLQK